VRSLPFPLLAALLPLASAAGQGVRPSDSANAPLTVAQVLSIRDFGDRQQLDVTSDGRHVAFSLVSPRRAAELAASDPAQRFTTSGVPTAVRGSDVFVVDTRTGSTRDVTTARGSSWAPVWSPDGRTLAFFSDRDGVARLWLWDRDHDTMRRLSKRSVHVYFGFEEARWTADGVALLVKVVPDGMSLTEARRLAGDSTAAPGRRSLQPTDRPTAMVYSSTEDAASVRTAAPPIDRESSFLNASIGDLVLIDATTGVSRPVARRVRAMAWRFAPDGSQIAFTIRQPYDTLGVLSFGLYDLWIVDRSGANVRQVVSRAAQEYGLNYTWRPDGHRIAYTNGGALEIIDLVPGARAARFAESQGRFDAEYQGPLWLGDTAVLSLSRDTLWRASLGSGGVATVATGGGRRLRSLVSSPETGLVVERPAGSVLVVTDDPVSYRAGLARIDLTSGAATTLFEGDIAFSDPGYGITLTHDGQGIVFQAESGDRPGEIWVDSAGGFGRLTNLNAGITTHALGTSRLVSWRAQNGTELRGALLLPPSYQAGKKYPLVVMVYGGSLLSRRVNRFGLEAGAYNLQLLATRGYAVLLPDAPLHVGTVVADLAASVLPGIDTLIALGIADPERVGLLGHSFGGYSVLALATQSPRFKAVVSSAGFGDLFARYTEMRSDGSAPGIDWAEKGQGLMGSNPWDARDRYLTNSPFFTLDRVNAPVLLLHGAADQTVFPERAKQDFVALRRLGKAAELVLYEGEDHAPDSWGLANVTDYWNRIIGWFGRYLKGEGKERD
jgi:dipeptidyl aminopeptidase/acylaminoacyl peptidase